MATDLNGPSHQTRRERNLATEAWSTMLLNEIALLAILDYLHPKPLAGTMQSIRHKRATEHTVHQSAA